MSRAATKSIPQPGLLSLLSTLFPNTRGSRTWNVPRALMSATIFTILLLRTSLPSVDAVTF